MKKNTLLKRRYTFFWMYLLNIPLFFFALADYTQAQTNKPNIILILADDIGYKALKCNGGNLYSTPNINTLANKGMRFTQCYSTPICSPSRVMLLTGKYNFRNYIEFGVLDSSQLTIANFFKEAGYKTGCFGKWQLDGGDQAITSFGFENYIVHDAWGEDSMKSRYKKPHLYTNGAYLANSKMAKKYGPDVISDSVFKFIEKNKTNPFFIYYPIFLAHAPFCPTPDDPAYTDWEPVKKSNPQFFPSMVKYMDKKIGELIDKVKKVGIAKSTVIIFLADNGTPTEVTDYIDTNGNAVPGGKGNSKSSGTHVPLIIYWPDHIAPGSVNNDLIDFTDFFPTLAGIANLEIPASFTNLDGVDFSDRLTGGPGTPRGSVFNYYNINPNLLTPKFEIKRWAQTQQYKLYDTSAVHKDRLFYNIVSDPFELNPIPESALTPQEKIIMQNLLNAINLNISKGTVLLKKPFIANKSITDSSVKINSSYVIDGGSTITSFGVTWDKKQYPIVREGYYTSDTPYKRNCVSSITGLASNTKYYVRTYAINKAGIIYSNQIRITIPPRAPVAFKAKNIKSDSFTAHWQNLPGIDYYSIDISKSPTFVSSRPDSIYEQFSNGIVAPKGWIFAHTFKADFTVFGKAAPSIEFLSNESSITTSALPAKSNGIKFWLKAKKKDPGYLLIEGFDGFAWWPIDNIPIPVNPVIKIYNSNTSGWRNNFIRFKFSYTKTAGDILLDDININYTIDSPLMVTHYQNKKVLTDSLIVTGLEKNQTYYYRVRANNENGISGNSNTIAVTTTLKPVISSINATNPNCYSASTGSIDVYITGKADAYLWTGPGNFTASGASIKNLTAGTYKLIINPGSLYSLDTSITLIEPLPLTAAIAGDSEICFNDMAILFVTARGELAITGIVYLMK